MYTELPWYLHWTSQLCRMATLNSPATYLELPSYVEDPQTWWGGEGWTGWLPWTPLLPTLNSPAMWRTPNMVSRRERMDWMAISSGSITSCPSANLKNKNYRYTFFFSLAIIKYTCTLGWVNLYQKFELEKYTVCSKLISKKWKGVFLNFGTTGLRICMDLRKFASFLYLTLLKICSQKFDRK